MNRKEQHLAKWVVPFFCVRAGQHLSLIGSSLAQFALVWWVTETTGSATALGVATIMTLLPSVSLGVFAGALVDRWNRRVVMIVADGFVALIAAWLAYLFWTDSAQVGHVFAIMLARAIGDVFHRSAMQASVSLMVPKQHLPCISGIEQTMHGLRGIICPSLAAFLVSILRLHSLMTVDVVTGVLAIVSLSVVSIPEPRRDMTRTEIGVNRFWLWDDVQAGLRYIWRWPGLLALYTVTTLLNLLCGPAFLLMPILITKEFGGGALQLGEVGSIWGISQVMGGLILSVWGGFRRRIATYLMAVIGVGVGFLFVVSVPMTAFPLALVGIFIVGAMSSISGGSSVALLQEVVIPEMQGRVFAVVGSLISGMAILGTMVAGPIADALGVRAPYLVGGVAQVLIGLTAFFVPALMHLEDNNHVQTVVEGERTVVSHRAADK